MAPSKAPASGQPSVGSAGQPANAPFAESASGCAKGKKEKSKKEKKLARQGIVSAGKKSKPVKGQENAKSKKPNGLVEELKLFQNQKLLNQEDPMQHLQIQLGQILHDNNNNNNSDSKKLKLFQQQTKTNGLSNKSSNNSNQQLYATDDKLRPPSQIHKNPTSGNDMYRPMAGNHSMSSLSCEPLESGRLDGINNENENISTIKKGVLWQQQHYEKFHQRLFSRWKKRYFILTTDYLVCFKRSSSKVGCSEMGQFLYKTSLNDISHVDWLKPSKSDKGAIVLRMAGNFNLYLWCKNNLDDWMFMIGESVDRYRIRKSCILQQNSNKAIPRDQVLKLETSARANSRTGSSSKHKEPVNSDNLIQEDNNGNLIQVCDNNPDESLVSEKQLQVKPEGSICEEKLNRKTPDEAQQSEPKLLPEVAQIAGPLPSRRDSEPMINHASDNDTKGYAANRARSGRESNEASESSCSSSSRIKKQSERKKETSERPSKDAPSSPAASVGNLSSAKPINAINEHLSSTRSGSSTSTTTAELSSSSSLRTGKKNAAEQDSKRQLARGVPECTSTDDTKSSSPSSLMKGKNLVKPVKRKSSRHKPAEPIDDATAGSPQTREVDGKAKEAQLDEDRSTVADYSDQAAIKNNESLTNGSEGLEEETAAIRETREEEASGERLSSKSMIRRDDSWQSLVSLTRVGKVTPMTQVAQRSLYAQQMIQQQHQQQQTLLDEGANKNGVGGQFQNATNKQIISLIESNATPSRSNRALVRHQSVQGPRVLRASLFDQRQHPVSASFDVAPNCNISPDSLSNASHRQKLLQLQLLHNSNNVDRIRYHAGNNDQSQIYNGPESVATTTHYGYSSMRGNLKSAASEFSFIRPSSSSYIQSTLPHQPKQQNYLRQQAFSGLGPTSGGLNVSERNSLILTQTGLQFNHQQHQQRLPNDQNNNDISVLVKCHGSTPTNQQYLVHPVTGERILNQRELFNETGQLSPPVRELPLKPNKKRTLNEPGNNGHKSDAKKASLTSTISCFFKRVFSRRSARNGRSLSSSSSKRKSGKLEEACSSSIGALAMDGPFIVPLAPSAFSTGSKSVMVEARMGEKAPNDRMIDMIEAFTWKHSTALTTTGDENNNHQITSANSNMESVVDLQRQSQMHQDSEEAPGVSSKVHQHKQQTPLQMRKSFNQFGSPLHKSNSISTSMGLTHTEEAKLGLIYDNSPAAMAALETGGASPMLMRSTKVMSANLTPSIVGQKQSFLLSPRVSNRRPDGSSSGCLLPRPSSIYGQPSMISSPPTAQSTREFTNNFGLHRNSLHNQYYQPRDKGVGKAQPEIRLLNTRHHQMGAFQLDTTREVAEELSSPVNEISQNRHLLNNGVNNIGISPRTGTRYSSVRGNLENFPITSSPSSGRLQQYYNRQAIVNPILQSPTMDAIYDNHPIASDSELMGSTQAYSHYDNHNQLLIGEQQHQRIHESPSGRGLISNFQFATPASQYQPMSSDQVKLISTPSRLSGRFVASSSSSSSTSEEARRKRDWVMEKQKPSAVVTPSMSHNNYNNSPLSHANPLPDRSNNYNQHEHPSPFMLRRTQNQQQHTNYQQSPLVSHPMTRILQNNGPDSVMDMAGPPGSNLDPSLAASLLRRANIKAYESSTFDRNSNLNQSRHSNRKTFLVSTRSSNSMAPQTTTNGNHDYSDERSGDSEENCSTSGGRRNWITSKLAQQDD